MRDEIENMTVKQYIQLERRYLNSLGRTKNRCHGVTCASCLLLRTECDFWDSNNALEDFKSVAEKLLLWEKEHPIRTRQSIFLEHYPNARVNSGGSIDICSSAIDKSYGCSGTACAYCKEEYWKGIPKEGE